MEEQTQKELVKNLQKAHDALTDAEFQIFEKGHEFRDLKYWIRGMKNLIAKKKNRLQKID